MQNVILAGRPHNRREECASVLTERGCQVVTVDSGIDCLTRLRAELPELLILSADLPWGGADGVLETMRDDPMLSQIPVILTAPHEHRLHRSVAPEPPVVRVVAEPIPTHLMFDAVAECAGLFDTADRFEVLVVENDTQCRGLLREYLRRQGYRVWTANNCQEALDLCCEHGEYIAVVLLDIHLPAFGGLHTFEGLKAYDPSIPVCVVSDHVTDDEVAELYRFGVRHVFHKPPCLSDVGRVVRELANEPRAVTHVW